MSIRGSLRTGANQAKQFSLKHHWMKAVTGRWPGHAKECSSYYEAEKAQDEESHLCPDTLFCRAAATQWALQHEAGHGHSVHSCKSTSGSCLLCLYSGAALPNTFQSLPTSEVYPRHISPVLFQRQGVSEMLTFPWLVSKTYLNISHL